MAEYTFNPRPKENAPTSTGDGTERKSARIWNVFKPSIILDELSLPQTPNTVEGSDRKNRIEDFASMEFPLVKINDYYLSSGEIDSFKIDCTGKIPSITLSASFTNELFLSKNMPKDGDIISVSIRSKSESLRSVRNDYVITGVMMGKRNTNVGGPINITFFGSLFIPGWRGFQGDSSQEGTSIEVLKVMANQVGLGFNTNEDNTDDKQIWYICNTPREFVEEVCERAWKDENSFFDWWIDIYYNFNFVNVQKQLLASETEIDEAAVIGNVPTEYYWGSTEDKTVATAKVLSNYYGFRTTSFYIRNWRPVNKSSSITFDYGASMVSTFFEHNNILYEDPEAQKYWNLDIAPNYDPEKVNNHILLRGRPTYDPSINNNEPARANYNYSDLYKTSPWLGIQYTISNPDSPNTEWSGNHHRNYMRARSHNTINKAELEKLIVNIDVQGTNLNIIKGDKVPIVLIKKDRVEGLLVQEDFNAAETLEFFYSGWYYVKGFTLNWTGDGYGNILTTFSQTFDLTRREWPAPVPVDSQPKAKTTEVKET